MRSLALLLLPLAAAVACSASGPDYTPATPQQLALLKNGTNISSIQGLTPQADGSFSFVVIGDNRSGDDVFRETVAQINAYAASHSGADKPLFVVHTGDIVPTGLLMEWHNYARLREGLLLPMVHVRGNHEVIFGGGAQNYAEIVGQENWTFTFADCRFIGIDNALGYFTDEAVAQLTDSLALPADDHTFVFFHEPPGVGRWTVHSVKPDEEGGRGGEVMAAIAGSGCVDAVFLGHIHLYDEMEIDGISYVISGGAGSPLHGQYGFGTVEHGFVVVTVHPDGVSWKWVPLVL